MSVDMNHHLLPTCSQPLADDETSHVSGSNETIIRKLLQTDPSHYAEVNFHALFAGYDAVADMPIPQLFPFILAAFPNALVIHSLRDPFEWVERRSSMQGLGPGPAKPLSGLFARLSGVPTMNTYLRKRNISAKQVQEMGMLHPRSRTAAYADAMLYSAENAYYRCITPKGQYLPLHPFRGELCNTSFVPRLARFLSRDPKRLRGWLVPGCPANQTWWGDLANWRAADYSAFASPPQRTTPHRTTGSPSLPA
jgi:hypothetical protein